MNFRGTAGAYVGRADVCPLGCDVIWAVMIDSSLQEGKEEQKTFM